MAQIGPTLATAIGPAKICLLGPRSANRLVLQWPNIVANIGYIGPTLAFCWNKVKPTDGPKCWYDGPTANYQCLSLAQRWPSDGLLLFTPLANVRWPNVIIGNWANVESIVGSTLGQHLLAVWDMVISE